MFGLPAPLLSGLPVLLGLELPPLGLEKLFPDLPSGLRLFLEKDGFPPLGLLDLGSPRPIPEGLSLGLKAS